MEAEATTQPNTQSHVITRTLHVHISGSLGNLDIAGPAGSTWKPVDGKQTKVFGLLADNMDAQLATNQLRSSLIHEVNILEHTSTFPVPLGVTISCIPSSEFTDLGQAYAYTVLPRSNLNVPQNVYKCNINTENSLNWRNEYPRWNSHNLESEGVLEVPNNSFVFVHQEHPVIGLLRSNSNLIGCNIDDQPKVDDEWFKVARPVLMACCHTLRTKVLNNIATNDLNTASVAITRLGAESWQDMTDPNTPMQDFVEDPKWTAEELDKAQRAHLQRFLSKPYSYMARLQIKYEVQNPA